MPPYYTFPLVLVLQLNIQVDFLRIYTNSGNI